MQEPAASLDRIRRANIIVRRPIRPIRRRCACRRPYETAKTACRWTPSAACPGGAKKEAALAGRLHSSPKGLTCLELHADAAVEEPARGTVERRQEAVGEGRHGDRRLL